MAANPKTKSQEPSQVSTHSHPKVAAILYIPLYPAFWFQHTATRRWLLIRRIDMSKIIEVSTHSHPKVAAPYIKKQEKSAN